MSYRALTPLTLAVAVAGIAVGLRSGADDKPAPKKAPVAKESPQLDTELRTFMRIKLQLSNQILEGLCTEDLDLVKNAAKALGEMSTAERWRVSTDPLYRQFSGEFREISQELVKAAEEGNMDRATLKWVDATMSCVDCHRFVRGMRIAN